ncbi:YcxB family protein [Streptomyces cylindrosporus]|uniref:YcxB family protein n=1 Tax=Streptomyces cylindrosporus TaxID=2927583 RepID=A0ABS9XXW7_9ACTN|nr:YcxB family protein [Streptomyces cylindrosporus]MCI3269803.1 YcxB family protein [Streptomyces cylindrosporus]
MVMDMGRDAGQGVVELTYEPMVEDFSSALRARTRVSRVARRQLWVFAAAGVCGVALAVLRVAGIGDVPAPLCFALIVCGVLSAAGPWLTARQFQRLAHRNGTFRVSVTDAGVSMVTDHTTATVDWTAQPRYRETPRVFVLFSPDANAAGFTVLPKRGLSSPADADRLREILDRNLTRV